MTELRRAGRVVVAALDAERRRITRDRRALVLMFLVPVAIASIIVFALSGDDEDRSVSIGWVATAEDPSVDRFLDEVLDHPDLAGLVQWEPLPSVAVARERVADADPGAALVLTPAPSPLEPAGIDLLAADDPLAAGIAATVIDSYRVEHAAAVASLGAATPLAPAGSTTTMVIEAPEGGSLDAAVHWGPALGAFFVLLGIGHAAHRQVEDRQRGITGRMASTPAGVAPVIVGRALAATAVGCLSLLVMAAATGLLFGRPWGPWPQLVVVAAATALAIAGVGAVIAAVVRSPGGAQSLTAAVTFGLAIAGGTFSPSGTQTAWAWAGDWLPTKLSLDAFNTATTTADWGTLVRPVVALCVTGLVLLAASGRRAAAVSA